jgi:hypothetical protein
VLALVVGEKEEEVGEEIESREEVEFVVPLETTTTTGGNTDGIAQYLSPTSFPSLAPPTFPPPAFRPETPNTIRRGHGDDDDCDGGYDGPFISTRICASCLVIIPPPTQCPFKILEADPSLKTA